MNLKTIKMTDKIFSLMLMLCASLCAWAQGGSGQGYDPVNPPDPQAGYRLKLESSPAKGGYVNPSDPHLYQAGEAIWCEASARVGYEFREWREGDKVVSTSPSFSYEMPYANVTLTAWFDKVKYDPENPADPYLDGYTHRVNIYTTPSTGGYSNNSAFLMKEGDETWIYAYPNSNFKFSCWKQNGEIISTSRELKIKMGKQNLEYTAQYVYDPSDPGDPLPNLWNAATGDLIIDSFTPGSLWSTIENLVGYDNCRNVTTLTVIGKMDNYDLGCVRNLSNLTDADFSRTSGCAYVPSYIFQDCQALTKVCLPASVEEIQYAAFYGCSNLSEIDVYASMPPTVDSEETFRGVPENMAVKVYSSSIDLYENAPYWKDYTIMTLDKDNTSLTVYLPEDADDGRYRNASLQLNCLSTGQTQRLIITGSRTKYIFGNLIPDMKYSLYVLAPNGTEIGSETDFSMPAEGMDLRLASLKQMKEVRLSLLTPEGNDVAAQAGISWFDTGHTLLGNGAQLPAQIEGDEVCYEVTLPRELGTSYSNVDAGTWTVAANANVIAIYLQPHATGKLSGKITDAESGDPIAGAYVTVAQKLNGQHDTAATATTGTDGTYSLEIYDVPGTLTAGSRSHVETTAEFSGRDGAAAIADASLKPLKGTEIDLTLLSRDNVAAGTAAGDHTEYADHANVDYTVRNATKGYDVDYRLRYPTMTLLDPADDGDEIEITAIPGNSNFRTSSASAKISGGKGTASLEFVSLGDLRLGYTDSSADEVVALLYDGDGILVRKSGYTGRKVAFNGLEAGKYTVVTMASSAVFSGAGSLDQLRSSKLSADSDYIVSEAEVSDGYITEVMIDAVPVFDESLFLYTGNETSISVNKTSVTVGATVTVRAKAEFRPEYAGRIGNLRMSISIPDGCEYVDNSLIVPGNGARYTSVADGMITMEMATADAMPRFCIIPRKGGDFRPSAMIEFDLDGETIRQPIGTALFSASDFTLSVPPRTSSTRITARGGTAALSEVKVYDNDVPVGTTRSLTNGSWRLAFDLYEPGDVSQHVIRAEITTPEGVRYRTTAATTLYDRDWAELTDIEMIYGGTTVDLNHIDATTFPASYSYVPGNDMFTFKTTFREGHAEKVKDLFFVIQLSDGSYRRMEGVYLPSSSSWTCAIGFPDVNRLPVNVQAFYSETRDEDADAPEWNPEDGIAFRCPDVIPVIDPSGYVYEAVPSNRLEGVEATIFYKEWTEDMYGDVHEKMTKWDAEAYAQENPLFTDAEGMYQWDVPQGEWMVRFEKAGYETASTDWLPVPPPQLDVNVGMKQMVSPQVKEAHAYPQSVDIEFDKYMDPARINASTFVVTVNGQKAEGTISMIDPEEADGSTYASAFRFEAAEPFSSSDVSLLVSNKAASYAGIQMEQPFQQDFTVEPSLTAIRMAEETKCYVGGEGTVSVEVLPAAVAAGKTLKVTAGSSIVSIDGNATLDDEGKAELAFKGILPGVVDIAVSVEGSSLPPAQTRLTLTMSPIEAESVVIDKTSAEIRIGDTLTLSATVAPESTTDKTLTWTSSDEAVATVDAEGNVKAIAVGEAVITATCGSVSATCKVTVLPILAESVVLSQESWEAHAGESVKLTATVLPESTTDKTLIWTSSDEAVATVDAEGNVKAIAVGEAVITATCGSVSATCKVTVLPILGESVVLSQQNWEAHAGESVKITATVLPESTTDKTLNWTSSDEAVATVDAEGNVKAIAVGEAVITATCGNVSATCKVTVLPILVESLTIDPTSWSGLEGSGFTITATVLPENADDRTLTFESSDPSVATVDAEGNVKVLKEGACVITVSTVDGSYLTAECMVNGLSGVDAIFADPDATVDIYDMNGALLKHGCSRDELKKLKPAIYILRSGNTVMKTTIR